jgi:hypothetical protein
MKKERKKSSGAKKECKKSRSAKVGLQKREI